MALADTGPAPYAPVNGVVTMIGLFRDKTIPLPITSASIQRAGVEESLARRTFSSMKLLDLLDDDGNPTPTMQKIRVAATDEYKTVLAEWLREAYKPIFLYLDPATDDVQKVTDQFRHYEPSGMRNRMVTLFLGLCAEAGLIDKVPAMPRASARGASVTARTDGRIGPKKLPQHKTSKTPTQDGTGQTPPPASKTLEDAKSKYVSMLLEKAASQTEPDPDLLDRIERALGIAKGDSS